MQHVDVFEFDIYNRIYAWFESLLLNDIRWYTHKFLLKNF